MIFNQERIERAIEREMQRMTPLINHKEDLSQFGYWTIGYCQGRISLLEELLDEMEGSNNEH